jgi:hypothetical protein
MLCVPASSDIVAEVATPLELTVPVPTAVVPSRKVTVPLGGVADAGQPAPGQTVAVNVTVWPRFTGVNAARKVVVPAWLTVTGTLMMCPGKLPE